MNYFQNQLENHYHYNIYLQQTFENILDEFPDILSFKPEVNEIKQEVKHHIKTDGHPCHSSSRRLSPEKLKIAKSEFKMMEKRE